MKKSSIIKICSVVIVVVVIAVLAVLLRLKPAPVPVPAFKFLSGRALTGREEKNQSDINETLFVYSFEADFNDIVTDANSELTALGYINSSIPNANPPHIVYYLHGKKPIVRVSVYIIKNLKINVLSTPKSPNDKTPPQSSNSFKNGWVTIETKLTKQQNRFIAKMKQLFQKLRSSE